MASLADVLSKYEAPHGHTNAGTDKNSGHTYAPVYDALFAPIRGVVTRVVELGVASGASCQAWSEYFPKAHVLGIDITMHFVRFGKDNPRITFLEGDATTMADDIPGEADVIIDDASHRFEDQLVALAVWGPKARRFMIIEDVADINPNRARLFHLVAEGAGMKAHIIDLRGEGLPEDNVMVVCVPEKK